MGHLEHKGNPLNGFPSIKAVPRKLPVFLATEQMSRLLAEPKPDTVIGLRDRALLALLCGSGIRASECASLRCGQVDLIRLTICVCGKGGHERTIPLHPQLGVVMQDYERVRGASLPSAPFFRSRFGRALSHGSIYERVRTWGQRSRVGIPISPHRLRHTFATHLVRAGVGLVTIRDLLGHRQITSTQIYLACNGRRSAFRGRTTSDWLAALDGAAPASCRTVTLERRVFPVARLTRAPPLPIAPRGHPRSDRRGHPAAPYPVPRLA